MTQNNQKHDKRPQTPPPTNDPDEVARIRYPNLFQVLDHQLPAAEAELEKLERKRLAEKANVRPKTPPTKLK